MTTYIAKGTPVLCWGRMYGVVRVAKRQSGSQPYIWGIFVGWPGGGGQIVPMQHISVLTN